MDLTNVNSQITDALITGEQSDIETITQEILQASHAFTKTLEMENAVFQNQLNGAIKMTVDALHSLNELCKNAIALDKGNADLQQSIASLKQQLPSNARNTNGSDKATMAADEEGAPALNPGNQDLGQVLVAYVGLSYKNAVTAQQQMYTTQQAAATMIITTLLSNATVAINTATNNVLHEKASV